MSSPAPFLVQGLNTLPRVEAKANWYAAYTCSRHEKRVAELLAIRDIESFLPLYTARHRWTDRYMEVQLPLFPGYVFVRLLLRERLRVLEIPGVVRLVSCAGAPVPLPEEQIAALRQSMSDKLNFEPYPYLIVGRGVRVQSGPLQGLVGTIVRKKSRVRFVISVELIMRSISIEVDGIDLQTMPANAWPNASLSAAA